MKIVIDIDERDYEFIKSVKSIMKNSDTFQSIATDLFRATQEGTPYNSSGDLISREALKEVVKTTLTSGEYYPFHFIKLIDNAPTVIPADKGELDSENSN